MSNEQFVVAIVALLAAGSGPVIQWLLRQFLEWKAEDGQEVSPKTKRRLSILFSAVVPSVLYGLAVWLSPDIQYELGVHVGYVAGAFMSQQLWHGETKLPSGSQVPPPEPEAPDDEKPFDF